MDLTQSIADAVIDIASEAGEKIMEVYARDFEVQEKADQSPLTEADLAAHHHIVGKLAALTPDIPILSEESGLPEFSERQKWDQYWLVDPLDGTKEFIKKNGEFTVNIAFIDKHLARLGVVHVPARAETFAGLHGSGAWKLADGMSRERITVASGQATPVRVVGSRSHRGASLDAWLQRLGDYELLAMGSSLKICLVADGSADVYPRLGPTSEWDTAAAHGVLSAAGGHIITTDGEPLRYNSKDDILNPQFIACASTEPDWCQYLSD